MQSVGIYQEFTGLACLYLALNALKTSFEHTHRYSHCVAPVPAPSPREIRRPPCNLLSTFALLVASSCASEADLPSLSFSHDWSEAELCKVENWLEPGCCTGPRTELPPTAASSLDLRGMRSGDSGTCGTPIKEVLPDDASAYPLLVFLPEVVEADPFCSIACAQRGTETTFGVVLELPPTLSELYRPLVVAPPPWRYVYDHNSLAGDACLGGYQEFGERACVRTNYGGAIGFATDAFPSAGRAALIDLQEAEVGMVETCCPYLPSTR